MVERGTDLFIGDSGRGRGRLDQAWGPLTLDWSHECSHRAGRVGFGVLYLDTSSHEQVQEDSRGMGLAGTACDADE